MIQYISDSSDPDTKTVKTYIRILSDPGRFRQDMFLKKRKKKISRTQNGPFIDEGIRSAIELEKT